MIINIYLSKEAKDAADYDAGPIELNLLEKVRGSEMPEEEAKKMLSETADKEGKEKGVGRPSSSSR